MPTRILGFGTWHLGKRQSSVRRGRCAWCRKAGSLESYETRLWLVAFYVPLLPLGRKWIVDQCARCTHYNETSPHARPAESLAQFAHKPSPETALAAHAQLLSHHEEKTAADLRKKALNRFANDASLQAGLAQQLEHWSHLDDAGHLYASALKLDPSLPEVRVGAARYKMSQGELDEARRLLGFLEQPGAGKQHSLGPLDLLAGYYQRTNQHSEALGLASHLLRELPDLGRQSRFRKFVRASENALGRSDTILPAREPFLRRLAPKEGSPHASRLRLLYLGATLLVVAAAVALVHNDAIRRHRALYVLNAFGAPVEVQIDDQPPVTVNGLAHLATAEAVHHVRLTGAINEARDVVMRTGFFDRWLKRPLWVLNLGGEGVIEERTLIYAVEPELGERRLHAGEPWLAFGSVDYPFEEPPESVNLSGPKSKVVKTSTQWLKGHDAEAFLAVVRKNRDSALTFAENRLRRLPDQKALLKYYVDAATSSDSARLEAFLRSKLDLRPVLMQWHRAYQQQVESGGAERERELIALYDQFLQSDPDNGPLQFLRGRIEPDWDRQEQFYRSAINADPKLPWPWLGLSVRAAAGARWKESLEDLQRAKKLNIGEAYVDVAIHVARIAMGDFDALIGEYRARVRSQRGDVNTIVLLCDALAASGQSDKIDRELEAFDTHLPPAVARYAVAPIEATALYQAGRIDECERVCRMVEALAPSSLHAQALLALGKVDAALTEPSFAKVWEEPFNALAMSLALRLAGMDDQAARWRDRACAMLDTLTSDTRHAAAVLRAKSPVPLQDLDHVLLDPQAKALLLAVLAEQFPANRASYQALARRFNIRREPPYHLVERAIEDRTDGGQ
jgi:tetratricopeptide (TPR) repeat protein